MASSVHVRALCVPNTTRLAGSSRAAELGHVRLRARHFTGAVKWRLRETRPQLKKKKEIKMYFLSLIVAPLTERPVNSALFI